VEESRHAGADEASTSDPTVAGCRCAWDRVPASR
jgi:hypothetical protein